MRCMIIAADGVMAAAVGSLFQQPYRDVFAQTLLLDVPFGQPLSMQPPLISLLVPKNLVHQK